MRRRLDRLLPSLLRLLLPRNGGNGSASVVGRLTPTNGSVFETFPGCYLELSLYPTSVWYKTVFGFRTWVQEFSGVFTLLDVSSVDGATIETPNPSSMISPTSYSNIPTHYSYIALFRYQPCLDTHTHSRTHSHTTLTDRYSSRQQDISVWVPDAGVPDAGVSDAHRSESRLLKLLPTAFDARKFPRPSQMAPRCYC